MKTGMSVQSEGDDAVLGEEHAGVSDETPDTEEEAEAGEETGETPMEKTKADAPKDLSLVRKAEAALFLANRVVPWDELSKVMGVSRPSARNLVEVLKQEYEQKQGAIEVVISEEGAVLQAKPEFLQGVSELSKKPDLSRKATKILALVAKKGSLLQSELKKYFRGEIYDYTTELKQAGYIESEKRGNTRLLKPSKKFLENFQLAQIASGIDETK